MRHRTKAARTIGLATLAVVGAASLVGLTPVTADAAAPPVVTALSRHTGSTAGGELLAIHGRNLGGVSLVNFGHHFAAKVHHISPTLIEVRTPVSGAVLINVRAQSSHGTSARSVHTHFRFVAPPTVTALSSQRGPAGGGQRVTVHGRNFVQVRAVTFGGTRASAVHVVSSTLLTATTPRHTPLDTTMRVRTLYGTSASTEQARYWFVGAPVVTGVVTDAGPTSGGTEVDVVGSALEDVTSVTFGGARATVLASGSTDLEVRLPAHAAGLVHVQVTTRYGTTHLSPADTFRYGPPNTLRWSRTDYVDPTLGYPLALSCAEQLCAFGDTTGGLFTAAADAGWVQDVAPLPDGIEWRLVKCVSDDFCVASGYTRHTLNDEESWFNGTAWSPPNHLGAGSFYAVSCPSPTFCHAVAGGGDVGWDGRSWTRLTSGAPYLLAMACTSDGTCRGIGANGLGYVYSAGAWDAGTRVNTGGIVAAACSNVRCAAVTTTRDALVLDTSTGNWRPTDRSPISPQSISCASDGACTALDVRGQAATLTGDTWSAAHPVIRSGTEARISCRSLGSCEVVDTDGYATAVRDGVAGQPVAVDPTQGGVTGVACAQGLCVLLDRFGTVRTRRDQGAWSAPVKLSYTGSALACATSTWCVALGGGRAHVYDGAAWHDAGDVPDSQLGTLSCPAVDYCIAASGNRLLRFDGDTWTVDLTVPDALSGVSCSSRGHCLAIADKARQYRLAGTTWTAASVPSTVAASAIQTSVACPSDQVCFIAAGDGSIRELHGTQWTVTPQVGGTTLACSSPVRCIAVNSHAVATFDGTNWSVPAQLDQSPFRDWPSAVRTSVASTSNTWLLTAIGYVAESS